MKRIMTAPLWLALGVALGAGLVTTAPTRSQPSETGRTTSGGGLSALDYYAIGQLANRYAHALDTCSNNGYDYADLYTPDGRFIDNYSEDGFSKGGVVRAQGREQLARAAGGGAEGCKKPVKGPISTPGDGSVAWNGWSHLMVNHVITAAPEGATGRVYLMMTGIKGPDSVSREGGYEDVYVKTEDGWRIQTRTHVRTRAWHLPLFQTPDMN
jgi:hypothetical protein